MCVSFRSLAMNVITSNISADFLDPPGVPSWAERKLLYVETLRAAEPTLIGLQEVTPRQLAFVRSMLPEFTAVTVPAANPDPLLLPLWRAKYARFGFADPPDPYEVVLFYHTDTFRSLTAGLWWLSPTPERPSVGFGNVAPRALQWVQLHHRPSGREMVVFNTHIDRRSVGPMIATCRSCFASFVARDLPLIFMGDLNLNPYDPEYKLLIDDGWQDAHQVEPSSELPTFLYEIPGIPGGRIDHILFRGPDVWPLAWNRLTSIAPGWRVSDHDPVCVRFRL